MSRIPPANAPTCWQLRTTRLSLTKLPLLMGIVNVTPDSFSDGGNYLDAQRAVEHGLELVEAGADIIDVGGESTRPYATPVDAQEERSRVVPVVRELVRQSKVPVSIDTSKALVAEAALNEGAEIINDVTGLQGDTGMEALAFKSKVGVCVMHMQGTPATMQDAPLYDDVVAEVRQYLEQRCHQLVRIGIDAQRICLDPGIGFGKTHQHNLQLLSQCHRLLDLGCPLLVGHSRKGVIAHVLGDAQADRTAGSLGIALALAAQGVQILRIHDVLAVRQALQLFAAVGGLGYRPPLT